MSQINEWDSNNVILTGGTDGTIRMWSLGYTQVKSELDSPQSETVSPTTPTSPSITTTPTTSLTIVEEILDPQPDTNQDENATTTSTDLTSSTISDFSDINQETLDDLKKSSDSETLNSIMTTQDHLSLISQKSINDLENEFVLIEPSHIEDLLKRKSNNNNSESSDSVLKTGHKWQRELIFRSKLTMHTSFDRKDNSEPASVTALSISKDNKTIYVGDSRGRVFTWVCTENPGKTRADHWVRDELVGTCKSKACQAKFSINVRKHHCRDCGGVFCHNCTRFETSIPRLQILKPVRVCIECYNNVKMEEALLPTSKNASVLV
jgi:hypothetical protein